MHVHVHMNVYITSKKENIGNPKKHEYRLVQENELAYYLWYLHNVLYNAGITCFPLSVSIGQSALYQYGGRSRHQWVEKLSPFTAI